MVSVCLEHSLWRSSFWHIGEAGKLSKDSFSTSRKNPIVARMRNLEEGYLSLEDFTQGSLHQQIPSIKVVGILKNIQIGSF
jgi:hypothetical protein